MAKKQPVRTASVARTPEVIDVTDVVTLEEVKLVGEVGDALRKFVAGALAFFTSAKQLEVKAALELAEMQKVTAPATADEDEALQLRIKRCNAGKKSVEEHWHLICSTVFQFHRRLTGRRDRAVKLYDEAATLGNRHHNAWTAAAQRAADLENERRRRLAEDEARAARNRELDALEQKRLNQERVIDGLSDREQAYVLARVDGYTPHNAAARAEYRKPTEAAQRLEDQPKIVKAIEAQVAARALAQQLAATKALPLDVEVDTVKANVVRAAGATDRTTRGAEVTSLEAFRDAAFEGKHGIPRDLWIVDTAALNRYGKDMGELINKWPGVRATKSTRVV